MSEGLWGEGMGEVGVEELEEVIVVLGGRECGREKGCVWFWWWRWVEDWWWW